jgi:hypothetical protein
MFQGVLLLAEWWEIINYLYFDVAIHFTAANGQASLVSFKPFASIKVKIGWKQPS